MLCNKVIKFGYFNEKWGANFEQIATGHYASKKVILGETHYLATAKDPAQRPNRLLGTNNLPPVG